MKTACCELFSSNEVPYCLRIEAEELWTLQFMHLLYIRGNDSRLTLSFTTHEVTFSGTGLKVIWEGLSQHRICLLRLGSEGETAITSLDVVSVDDLSSIDPPEATAI